MMSVGVGALCALLVGHAWAQDAPPAPTLESLAGDIKTRSIEVDTVWTLMAAFLVFWMQAGFAFVETGLTRAKNHPRDVENAATAPTVG